MIIVTGGIGFIGSAFIWKLNSHGINDILIVDELDESDKWKNIVNKNFIDYIHKDEFLNMISNNKKFGKVTAIVHMGACTSTTERNNEYLWQNNYRYTRILAEWALKNNIRFIYASSAATYGDGTLGFSDDNETTLKLRPLNMYGYSKHIFDVWIIKNKLDDKVVGLKFFNVFGPNEYHKSDMASVVFKSFNQIKTTGKVKLFKSYKPEYKHGEQKRDFIYVKDCVEVMWYLLQHPEINGIFNCGTGKARTWNDLVIAVFHAMGKNPQIEYIDMPEEIRRNYQYFTEAKMDKLASTGYSLKFYSLEDAINDYVINYLQKDNPYL
jgi:ADP-L-glycero-D-manno-heptose 6-epimerase